LSVTASSSLSLPVARRIESTGQPTRRVDSEGTWRRLV
jgi:hypothetical protein